MTQEIEVSSLDLRYEGYRMRNRWQERRLLALIVERGIEQPLEGIEAGQERILLNGFKRYRCARRLGLALVPFKALARDEASAIVVLLRASSERALGILEQARFVDELRRVHDLGVADIAELLSRGKSWVSMRLGLIGRMSEKIRERIFKGDFPVYSYMYTLRSLTRMNGEGKREVEDFVEAVGGKGLSTRDIDSLAHGYFRGGEALRAEIRAGNVAVVLEHIKELKGNPEGLSELERSVLRSLELLEKCLGRVVAKHRDERLVSRTFHAEANLLTAGLLSRLPALKKSLEELHDRSGNAPGGIPSTPGGDGDTADSP